jgi:hypothetical protein
MNARMSLIGPKRTCQLRGRMSAFGGIADMPGSAQRRNKMSGQLLFEDRPQILELVEEVPDVVAGTLLSVRM